MRIATATALTLIAALAYAETRTTLTSPRQQPRDSGLTLHVTALETVVDVTVTDSQGKPVHGLKREDFTLNEDGKPQSLRSFQEFNGATATPPPTSPKLPPNTYTNAETGTGPLYVLLFDTINGGAGPRVKQAAATFIRNLAPGTRVALLSIGGRLAVLQGPTTDTALLLKRVYANGMAFGLPPMEKCVREVVKDWQTIDELNQVAAYLSGISGRKNLIWINNGVPSLVFPPTPVAPGDDDDLLCEDFSRQMRKVYDLLEDAQVTVDPLDSTGVKTMGRGQLSLEAVAEATGGVAYYERNDLETLMAQAVNDGSSYYTLSYAPHSAEYDGKYHPISITVDRPGLHLLYRKGYSAEDPTLILHPPEKLLGFVTRVPPIPEPFAAAMAPAGPPATQLLFGVHAEPTTPSPNPPSENFGTLNPTLKEKLKGQPLTRYAFQYAIPAHQITFTDGPNATHSGALELDLAAYQADGTLVTSLSQTVKMPLSDARYQQFIQGPFQFSQQLDLPPGQLFLRVGIRDLTSNKIGTLEIPLTVPKNPPDRASAAPAH